jgi:hypothetical protein
MDAGPFVKMRYLIVVKVCEGTFSDFALCGV